MRKQSFGFHVYDHFKLNMQILADAQGITRTQLLEKWITEGILAHTTVPVETQTPILTETTPISKGVSKLKQGAKRVFRSLNK